VCGLVWFEKSIQHKFNSAVFTKEHPNTTKSIRFFVTFVFYWFVDFYLDWFGLTTLTFDYSYDIVVNGVTEGVRKKQLHKTLKL
jgi:hypothetical protein